MEATLPRCYVASPLGFSESGSLYYRQVLLPALRAVVEPVDPWALTTPDEVAAARGSGRERELALEIGLRNARAIESSSLLVAHLDGQEVDSGTAAEVGFAAARGLVCFGLRSDLRQSGEPGMAVNLQVEYFIAASGGCICTGLKELLGELAVAAARAQAG
jgi:nucleoside 2-deoxyribosyltransferase